MIGSRVRSGRGWGLRLERMTGCLPARYRARPQAALPVRSNCCATDLTRNEIVFATSGVWPKCDSNERVLASQTGYSMPWPGSHSATGDRLSSTSKLPNSMNAEALPPFELLGPLIFVIGSIYVLSPILPLSRPWARTFVFSTVWLIIARYLNWRLFTTVIPVTSEWYQIGWVWFCFVVEALALFDALILYLAFLRTSNRHAEADSHEGR